MTEMENDLNFQSLNLDDTKSVSDPANVVNFLVDCVGGSWNINVKMTNQIESEAFKSVNLVGYQISENAFKKAIEEGPKSIEYTKLINYLTNELRMLCNIDECVNAIATPEDSVSFIMETSSFLNELGCPYASLTQGHVSDRLGTVLDRILLIQHLVTELMAARILRENRPEKKIELKLQESSQAADLRKILQTLGFPKPPANIIMQTLMQKLIPTVQNTVQKAGNELLGNPIFFGTLSDKQWQTLSDVQQDLHEDFLTRREMLLKRLDCTIQSFQWSDKTKGKDDVFNKTYTEKRKSLKVEPEVDLSDLLASRDDLAIIEKTSSALVRKNTKSAINKVIIGQVPDRGGRTSEQAPPPPEMPPWQQRSSGPAGGGGGGFRGGRQGQGNYGGQQSGFGGGSTFSQGGSNYSQSNYNTYGGGDLRGGGGGGRGRGGAFDSAGSYGGDSSRRGSDYSRGNNNSYSGGNSNDYSKGSNDYSRGGSGYSGGVGGGSSYSQGSGSNYSRGGGGNNDYSRGGGGYSQGSGNDFARGGNDYSRRGSGNDYSRGGSGSDYSKGGNDYSRGGSGSDYSRGGNDYSRGGSGNDYSKGGNDYSRGGSDSDYSRGSSNYSRGGSSYSQGNDDYSRGGSGSYSGSGGNRGGGFDSAGSYGGYSSQDYQEPKRAKTFDQFQQNKTTYADQYVQESQHNQQYHARDNRNRGGRAGRSNYSRGGGGASYR